MLSGASVSPSASATANVSVDAVGDRDDGEAAGLVDRHDGGVDDLTVGELHGHLVAAGRAADRRAGRQGQPVIADGRDDRDRLVEAHALAWSARTATTVVTPSVSEPEDPGVMATTSSPTSSRLSVAVVTISTLAPLEDASCSGGPSSDG